MGRAIAREPAAYLMDEPLSNLDAKLRVGMRTSLQQLHTRLGTTTVYVTHDQIEAMTLGERVAVMRDGQMQQVDAPQKLYDEPANVFVAAFIGSPAMNLVETDVGGDAIGFGGFSIPLDREPHAALRALRPRDRRHPPGGLRGRGIRPVRAAAAGRARLGARGARLRRLRLLRGRLGAGTWSRTRMTDDPRTRRPCSPTSGKLRSSPRAWTPGRRLASARHCGSSVDPSRLYFFSPETGESLLHGSNGSPQ